MYTIEYYKTKRKKPEIKEPENFTGNARTDYHIKRAYEYQKDRIDKCWNIKSITIDLEDLKHTAQSRETKYLYSLYVRIIRAGFDKSINAITILNNNSVNLLYIYEIISCKWMINANEDVNNLDILNIVRDLLILLDQYDKEENKINKRIIKHRISVIKYCLNTIINKTDNKDPNTKTLKLGVNFIK